MADNFEIETNIIRDFRQRFTDVGFTEHAVEGQLFEQSPSGAGNPIKFPIVSVGVQDMEPDFMAGPGISSGHYRASVLCDCQSQVDKDLDGDDVRNLARQVRDALMVEDIASLLNTLSTFNTYKSFHEGISVKDIEERIRHRALTFTVRLVPSTLNITTTTTT